MSDDQALCLPEVVEPSIQTDQANGTDKRRLLFVYADIGGGHLAAARAISAEIHRMAPGIEVELFDPTEVGPLNPLRRSLRLYGPIVRWVPIIWGLIYSIGDSPRGTRFFRWLMRRIFAQSIRDAMIRHGSDVVICLHPLLNSPVEAVTKNVPSAVVVTDLGSIHRCWLSSDADLITLPTTEAMEKAKQIVKRPEILRDTGLPINAAFERSSFEADLRARLRSERKLDDRFSVLISGGGEGFGPLHQQARALLEAFDDIHVIVVCGRNKRVLRKVKRLEARFGSRLVALGFVHDMAEWVHAVDVLAAKAGPGTIVEALACGTAMVMTGALPGQEQGNADHVVRSGAGVSAANVKELTAAVSGLRSNPELLAQMRVNAESSSRPEATAVIADELIDLSYSFPGLDEVAIARAKRNARSSTRRRYVRAGIAAVVAVGAWTSASVGVDVAAASEIKDNRPAIVDGTEFVAIRVDASQVADPGVRSSLENMNATVIVDASAIEQEGDAVREMSQKNVDIANGGSGYSKKGTSSWDRSEHDIATAGRQLATCVGAKKPYVFAPDRHPGAFDLVYSHTQHQPIVAGVARTHLSIAAPVQPVSGAVILDGRGDTPSTLVNEVNNLLSAAHDQHIFLRPLGRAWGARQS